MSPRKLIFLAVIAVIVVVAGIAFSMLSADKKDKGPKGPKELSVWVFADDVAGYEDVISGFKAKYPRYKATNVAVKKFASYSDYEKTLLNVMADGKSPDVFAISSDGGSVLASKAEPLPGSLVGADDFVRSFNRVFDDLIMERQEKNEEGKEVTITELKGVPLGYETMGAFYNADIVTNAVPKSWNELAKDAGGGTTSSEEEVGMADAPSDSEAPEKPSNFSDKKFLAGLGVSGKYASNAADLIDLFLVQSGFESYDRLVENGSSKPVSDYFAFGVTEESPMSGVRPNGNGLFAAKKDLDRLGLTVADLFARGKMGVVFGYPSYLREIQYAIKRASQENVLTAKNFRTTSIPFVDPEKPVNLARYQYFALSKYAPDQQAGLDFVTYLLTEEAQSAFIKRFPYYLPAMNSLADERKSQNIDKAFPRAKYESFLPIQGVRVVPFDKGFAAEYDAYFRSAPESKTEATAIISGLNDLL